ncbi:glycoside hydrolase family 71/99-like protein [Prevotella sp. P6B4]|uniref:glycoside hydrolase family 71/99-like protein n=1 Tax=Prevotella sp. P6B4 TaxID=1410614 RepID=UPI00055F489A|nr:glycoside hydrolase family 71/99-like protein [Prevotella sp. P6B4]
MMLSKRKLVVAMMVGAFTGLTIMACGGGGNDDYIPPAVQPEKPVNSDTPDAMSEYNSLGDDFKIHQDGEPFDTYMGLVMCGYQGWFGTPGDGSPLTTVAANEGWYHYRESEQFRPGVLRNSIDFWPDMSEYEHKYVVGDGDETGYSSPFILPDGSHATVFSSYDQQTVMTHFKWMKQYNIDGAFMQRFVGEIMDARHKDHFDVVLSHAMTASNEYQRAIAVMYDMSGITTDANMRIMVDDAQKLMNEYSLSDRSKQKYYLYENGKPMLALWGAGFNDNNHPKPSFLRTYVEQLKAQGWSIMLGCPGYWRQGGNDCVSGSEHTELIKLIKECDAFIPWYVGRYGHDNFTNADWQTRIKQDIATAKTYSTASHRVVYAEHIFPGGSDRNMHPNNGKANPDHTNTGFRFGGQFYWNQFYYDIKNGAQAIYVGMFDEMDEGTAIFKQLNVSKVPSNVASQDYYVNYTTGGSYSMSSTQRTGSSIQWSELASSLDIRFQGIDDDKPTDHYLWLTGEGRKMLNGQTKMTKDIPLR